MITGDHKDTATAIGHMLGIVNETYSDAITGPELDAMSDDELRKCVMTHNVFARASPQNKIRIVNAVKEGRVVWDNLRKVLLVNTPINNAQGLSVLFGIFFGFSRGQAQNDKVILTAIQVLYCNLICAVTLGFIAAVEPAEKGIMDVPPRRVGKRLIGRFLLLRIALG